MSRARRGRGRCERGQARRMCCSSCWTTPGSGSSAATAARSPRQISTRWPLAACSTRTCTPRPCARRRARASSPGATTTPTRRPRSTSWRPAIPATTAASRSRTASCRRCCCSAATARTWSASTTCCPRNSSRWRARSTAGRWGEASSGSTGSSAATPASGIRTWSRSIPMAGRRGRRRGLFYANHQVEPPRPPDEGSHLTEDLADKAIEFVADAKQIAPNKPFYLHFCTGATHAPHHVPREWADRYAGQFDDGWDAYRERVFARQKELGVMPPDAELSRHDPDVPEWESLSPDARRLAVRLMEGYAGFLSHTGHQLRPVHDFLQETGKLYNTLIMAVSDNGASAEGGPTGTTNELQF